MTNLYIIFMRDLKNKLAILALILTLSLGFPVKAAPLIISSDYNSTFIFDDIAGNTYDSLTINQGVTVQGVVFQSIGPSFSLISSFNNYGHSGDVRLASLEVQELNNYGVMGNVYMDTSNSALEINNYGTMGEIDFGEEGPASIIKNSGLISSGGDAIRFDNAGTTYNLILLPGSQIIGNLAFQNNVNVGIGSGTQETRVYHYTGAFNLEPYDTHNLTVVISDSDPNNKTFTVMSNITAVDPTPQNAGKISTQIVEIISSHLDEDRLDDAGTNESDQCNKANKNNSTALNKCYAVAKFNKHKTFYWSEAFGSYDQRSSYKSSGDLEISTGGVIFGADKAISSNQRLGGFIGALDGNTDIIGGPSNKILRSIDSQGVFGGGYLSTNYKSHFVDLALVNGLIQNNSNRAVNSNEMAVSNYKDFFFTPSITIGKPITLPKFNFPLTASTTMRYTGQIVESAQESGSSADIKTGEKYLSMVSGRVQLETNNKGINLAGGNFEINFKAGLEANRVIGNNKNDLTINGEHVTLTASDRKYNIDEIIGVDMSYDLVENLQFYTNIEASRGISKGLSDNVLGLYGKLGLKWSF